MKAAQELMHHLAIDVLDPIVQLELVACADFRQRGHGRDVFKRVVLQRVMLEWSGLRRPHGGQ